MKETQFGHIKLWFAGKLGNWKLAAYEFDQIAPFLEQAASHFPASEEQVARQVAALRNAIEAKDAAGFSQAYTELTNGCNSCHRSISREFINIQIPAASPLTDQDFANRVAEGRTLARTLRHLPCCPGQAQRAAWPKFFGTKLCRTRAPTLFDRSKPA